MLKQLPSRLSSGKWLTRALWIDVHLFLALMAGFVFALLGLTGSISVYREELDGLLNPELVVENPQGEMQSLDKIMDSVRQAHPDRYGEWTLEMPTSPDGMVTVWFDKPRETFFERYAPLMVSVNPYTAEVVASRFWGHTFTTWLLDWHTHLQYDDMGWEIVGGCGVLLTVSILTGLYLWWPGLSHLVSALRLRTRSGMIRLLFDLHRLLGVFSAGALLVLAFTGFQLSFPSLLEDLFGAGGMAHGETGPSITSTARPNDHPTVIEAAEFIARGPFSTAELRRVTTPAGESGAFRVNLRQKSEINHRHPFTTVWIDRWSGQIREVRDPKSFSAGQTFITWMWPLHTGEALGQWGRLAWFLAGQSLFILYVTGLLRWLNKKGWIKDREVRPVDLAPVARALKKGLFSAMLFIDRWMNVLASNVIPMLLGKLGELTKKVEESMAAYQSKSKK